jgi:hypothetical protein
MPCPCRSPAMPCRVNSHKPRRAPAILRQCRVLRESPPTCRLWTADANSHMPCHAHAAPMPRCAVALRSCFQNGMVVALHGRGMACVNQTRPHCVNQMGNTQSKAFLARHGRGTAWARHGNSMVCVN